MTDAIDALLVSATGFDWDAGNAPKVRARHQVDPGECEQAFFLEPFIVAADATHSQREVRWYALGRTFADRYLYLVFTMRGTRIRVLSARSMNRKERRAYAQAQARTETDSDL
ncbi:BrnT family toxin [Gemmatimonas sp.]|uniref:BrnT family toxin n=1 Tax=Gemmatimonas sp. TaxID=1962908 RepID=UPI00286E1D5D|nr:BrnT family toxin [Gemmatimonas sp.]